MWTFVYGAFYKYDFKKTNKTIRKDININVSKYNISDFKRLGGVPKRTDLFLNENIIKIISQLYDADIKLHDFLINYT